LRQILPGWNGRRIFYSLGRRNMSEWWEFIPEAHEVAASRGEIILASFLNGELILWARRDRSAA